MGTSSDRLLRALRILLLLCLFAQLVLSAGSKSPTIDEPNHLARGYAYLKTGDLRMSRDEGHPPLLNLLCAVPLLALEDLSLPLHSQSWQSGFRNAFAVELIFGGRSSVAQLFFLGRLPVMLVTLLLAALVARWAGELYGAWGSVIALALCAFDPNLIAHGRLVTTDAGIALTLFLGIYLFWRFLQRPSFFWLAASGVAVGLAQSTKFSAVILLPMLGLLGLVEAIHPSGRLRVPGHPQLAGRRWLSGIAALCGAMAIVVILAGLTVWAIYGFEYGAPRGWTTQVPAPTYVEGLIKTVGHASSGHPAFLMGQRSTEGWWTYFFVAFALKTPLPAMIALVCAALSNAWKRFSRAELPLLLVPLIYFALSIRSRLNIGYRHLLPMLPFLWTYVGRLGPALAGLPKDTTRRWARVGLATLGLWLAVSTLALAPNYLAFFNRLAGGPDGGWRYLVDSNLDWGGELYAIAAYAEREDRSPLYLSWFGSTYPHLYDVDLTYRLLPSHFSYPYPRDAARSGYNPYHPAPGLYAIGATNLQGVGLAAGDVFARFREQEPVARLAHSVFLYEVPDAPGDAQPTGLSGLRFRDLSDETIALSVGRGQGAVKWFDHTTSFILPGAGDPAFVLPSAPLPFSPAWQAAFLAAAPVVHTQGTTGQLPEAQVYHIERAQADAWQGEVLTSISPSAAYWSPSTRFGADADVRSLPLPVAFDGLELLGYTYDSERAEQGQVIEMITVWRVTDEMPAVASDLRIFVHLLDEESRVWGGEDRLDLHPPTWEPGDLLIQYHRLPVPAEAPPGLYQVEIGLYAAITLERLPVYVDETPVSDRLLLQPVEVIAP